MKPDYRYTAPDGTEVEAWQLTETSRYQDKLFPEWLTSRMFMTVNGNEDWLVDGDAERRIPPYGWLVYNGVEVSIVDAMTFEGYDKVVKEQPPEPPQEAPDQAPQADPLMDPVLAELKVLYEVGEAGGAEEVHKELKKAIGRRILWCNCPPGQCEQLDRWSCRQESPLVK